MERYLFLGELLSNDSSFYSYSSSRTCLLLFLSQKLPSIDLSSQRQRSASRVNQLWVSCSRGQEARISPRVCRERRAFKRQKWAPIRGWQWFTKKHQLLRIEMLPISTLCGFLPDQKKRSFISIDLVANMGVCLIICDGLRQRELCNYGFYMPIIFFLYAIETWASEQCYIAFNTLRLNRRMSYTITKVPKVMSL